MRGEPELPRELDLHLGPRHRQISERHTAPWTEVATRSDLADLRSEMHKSLRGQMLAFVSIVALLNGILFAALKLL